MESIDRSIMPTNETTSKEVSVEVLQDQINKNGLTKKMEAFMRDQLKKATQKEDTGVKDPPAKKQRLPKKSSDLAKENQLPTEVKERVKVYLNSTISPYYKYGEMNRNKTADAKGGPKDPFETLLQKLKEHL
ncbi:MAG: hypothetical protein GY786_14380, partial [Proteobacteria bacterium]|nr:hypothetical protein [Pseudomonadota bacterium]